ncbi:hypothetical protein E4O00_11200 [Treponema sp. OMZ 788]|uniref:hypothetical protein n=1 Tax=Treponema sp. OMZ 788 TaxID=2563664 RepID=UPI00220A8936|nr:hypothetical protein E4O00_11200 [Treponema sp. OMZ 788]
MLVAEYDYDTDIAVQREESLRIGIQQGFSDGVYQTKLETARNLFWLGLLIKNIAEAIGLPIEEIEKL